MFQTAFGTFAAAGHEVRTSDLHEMHFDPVSSRKNFTTVKEPKYLKLQIEEKYATEMNGFSEEIESEIRKIEWCEPMNLSRRYCPSDTASDAQINALTAAM